MTNTPPRKLRRRVLGAAAVAAVTSGVVGATPTRAQEESDQYVAEYADAVFTSRNGEVHLAPGEINDQGTITEVLEASIYQQSCEGRFLIEVDVSTSVEADDLPDVTVESRAGFAKVRGTFTFTGELTITPAGGRNCSRPNFESSTTAPLTTDVNIKAKWENQRRSVPIIYSGEECGGDGVCYYRDARAEARWSSDFLGRDSDRSTSGFFWEGTYSAESATLARVPIA